MYEEIDKLVQENNEDKESELESPKLDYRDVERILTVSGVEDVDTAKVEHAFKTVVADETYEFKASSVVPKKVKIETKIATVSIDPKELKNVKYVTFNGKKCLLLEVNEDVVVEGFRLEESETF